MPIGRQGCWFVQENIIMKLIIIPLLLLPNFSFATDIYAYKEALKPFESLTFSLFDSDRLDHSFLAGIQVSEIEDKALDGGKYLYCSIIADYLFKIEDAPKLYDKGMALLDDYVAKHATRDSGASETLKNYTFFSKSIPTFHQSWLINDKQILKGIIFENIYKTINEEFYKNNPLANRNHSKFIEIYSKRCKVLNK